MRKLCKLIEVNNDMQQHKNNFFNESIFEGTL